MSKLFQDAESLVVRENGTNNCISLIMSRSKRTYQEARS
jgi:hypothetical protein